MFRTCRYATRFALISSVIVGCFAYSASALLIGAPTFTTGPTSSLGLITGNTLTITPFPNGFSVAGQIQVTVPFGSGPQAGVLLAYEVDYPIDPAYPFNPTLFTTTAISGYSLPPPGSAGNTVGTIDSAIVTLPGTVLAPSVSTVPLSLVAGFDSPLWTPAIVANSSVFGFTGAPNMVLRQRFTLDGIYNSGPGGVWTIDIPAITTVNDLSAIPEPSVVGLMALGGALAWWRRRRGAHRGQ